MNYWKNHHQWFNLRKAHWGRLKKGLVLNQFIYLRNFKTMTMVELFYLGQDWRLNFNLIFSIKKTNFTDFHLRVQFLQLIIIRIIWRVWGNSHTQYQVKELMKWWEFRRKIRKISRMTHTNNKMMNRMKMITDFLF